MPQVDTATSSQGLMHIFPRWMLVCFFELCARGLNDTPLLSVIILGQLVWTEEFETEFAYSKYSRRAGSVIPHSTGNDALHP